MCVQKWIGGLGGMHAYDATHFEFAGNHAPCLEDFIFQHSPHAGELIGNRDLRQEEGSVESRCTTALPLGKKHLKIQRSTEDGQRAHQQDCSCVALLHGGCFLVGLL